MEESLISLKTANLAKEKGFVIRNKSYFRFFRDGSTLSEKEESIPTQEILQKWLRELHYTTISIGRLWLDNNNYKWSTTLAKGNTCKDTEIWEIEGMYDTYEAALEEALIQSLKLIK